VAAKKPPGTLLRRWVLRRWVPYALFVLGCVLSVGASWYVSSATAAQIRAAHLSDQATFIREADRARQQIQVRLDTNVELIRAGAALLAASNEISEREFRAFVAGLQLRPRPGIDGMGFAQRVHRAALPRFRRALELDGITSLRGWQPGLQDEYHPVLFLEPRDRVNRSIVGQELSADPVVREAMARARDTGQPAASGKVGPGSPFDRKDHASFVVLVPVYRVRMPVQTVAERQAALFGFVFGTFSAPELFDQVTSSNAPSILFDVYDGKVADPASLLSRPSALTDSDSYHSSDAVNAAGRDWLVVVRSLRAPVGTHSRFAPGPLIGGLFLSWLLLLISRAQLRAWETSARHEMALRASQDALRESEAQAQAADRAKDEFLATLSHELRTPLNTMLGWVTMLRGGSVRPERQAYALEVIERNARLQSKLVEDLLDVSRIVMGKVRLRLRPIDANPIVTAAVDSLRPSAEAAGVQLYGPTMKAPFTIRADAERIQQIVWNLVSNAIKFTPAGGRVDVELAKDERSVRLSVRDTGVGIAAEFLPQMFERFRQADSSATRPHSGLGLGLSIVRHLVELQGGSIEAFSEGRDRGALFVVEFPLASSTPGESPVALVGSALSSPFLAGYRILIVDDDPSTRELLTEALSVAGAQVVSAESAGQALHLLAVDGADVLISDIAMPEEDGLSLIRQVRALPGEIARVPAIALTAFARADDRDRAIAAGYQMHLAKPVELADLQAAVAKLVRPNGSRAT
jgi:signal transduction histidine kinase/ActR/RegA family two-component response regulator